MTISDIDVLILAGGCGERSRSYLGNTPKFLAPIGVSLLAALLLDYLTKQGIRRVVLALSSGDGGADQILKWIGPHQRHGMIDILTSIEPEPRGITSAIIAARPQLLSDPVMIINGDTLLDLDLATVLSRYEAMHKFRRKGALCVVSPEGAHTGCTIIAQETLSVNTTFSGLYQTAPKMTTSRRFVDIGTREGCEAACSGAWRK